MTSLPSLWLLVWLLAPSASLARIHFAHGQRLFREHDYRRALDEFTTAAEASPAEVPDLWFDIGQCHRNLGHARLATLAFEHYLTLAPDAPDRAKVQAMLAQLSGHPVDDATDETASRPTVTATPALAPPDVALAANAAPATTTAEAAAPVITPATTTSTASAPPTAHSRRRRWLVWAGIAGGVVLGGVAIGLGVGLSEHGSSATPALGSAGTFDTRHH
ncbi:MAG TPA: tetratricopeptide repeat protein [Polyangia bacterium]|nr:tetratricopeptide repeat protein [Polyangia bacterium]